MLLLSLPDILLPRIHKKLEGISYWKELTEHGLTKHWTFVLPEGQSVVGAEYPDDTSQKTKSNANKTTKLNHLPPIMNADSMKMVKYVKFCMMDCIRMRNEWCMVFRTLYL